MGARQDVRQGARQDVRQDVALAPEDWPPCLDCMEPADLHDFVRRYAGSGDETTGLLVRYAMLRLKAESYRLNGFVNAALAAERTMDDLYRELADSGRW